MHRRLEKIYYEIRRPRLTWGDVGGYAEAKALLKEMVCLPLMKGKDLAAMSLEPPAGVLMWGPLGTGMTMLAEACASEAGVTFAYVSGQEMLGKPRELERAFREAEEDAPAVLYVSDIDWLAPRAGASYEWAPGNERGKPPTFADAALTETLIREVDRLQKRRRVSLIGGCYRIDVVDQAVIKEKSRFNRKVFLPPPDAAARRDILALYTGRVPVEGPLDLDGLAARTEGFVGWDLESLVKRAGLIAVEASRRGITGDDLIAALGAVRPWLTPDMTEGYHRLHEADCPHHYHF